MSGIGLAVLLEEQVEVATLPIIRLPGSTKYFHINNHRAQVVRHVTPTYSGEFRVRMGINKAIIFKFSSVARNTRARMHICMHMDHNPPNV